MKRSLILLLPAFFLPLPVFSQGFAGINSGNYAGITGVMLQPASIVDSRHKFDFNFFSTDVRYSNNYFLLNRNVLLKFNKSNFDDYPTFRSKYLSEATLAGNEKVFFNIANRTQLPVSFMLTLGEKSALAFNLQSRSMIQGRNIGQDMAKLAFNSFYYQPLTNQGIDASALSIRSLNWVEAGLTYGRVLLNSGNHFIKGAFTAKYLGGVSSLNIASNNLTVRVNDDSTFNFATDRVSYEHNKNADFSRVIDSRFRPDANAFGFDAGLVYEYRGHLINFKYIRNDDETSNEIKRRDLNKYIFKLGVSLLDAGMFRFTKAASVNSFGADITNWDIRNSRYASLNEFDTALANRVTPLANDARDYNMYLPGALSVQMDIRFVKGLYLNAMAYRPLKIGSEKGTRFNNYGYYSLTPRYEKRHFGIYIPYTFSDKDEITNYRDNWLGLTLRLGPVFFGSSNLGSMAFNQTLKAADFFVGLKMGFTYGKPSNLVRLFTQKNKTDYEMLVKEKEKEEGKIVASNHALNTGKNKTVLNTDTTAANRLVVDYSKGQVYTDGRSGQVIIVNNHYYYGNAAANRRDTVYAIQDVLFQSVQQNTSRMDSTAAIMLAQKRNADSVNKVFSDSLAHKREQLDSLINRLNHLRQRLDSADRTSDLSGHTPLQNNDTSSVKVITMNESIRRDITEERNDSLRSIVLMIDSFERAGLQTAGKVPAKKKVTNTSALITQQQTGGPDLALQTEEERSALVAANSGSVSQPKANRNDAYEVYIRQSESLQADIQRLERQIAYNRSVAYAVVPPIYNQPYYENIARPSAASNPAFLTSGVQPKKDTIFIRDTVFLTKTDTNTNTIRDTPTTVFVDVHKEKIVKEKVDYKNLPPETILFATGHAIIRKVYINKLMYIAGILHKNPNLMISIWGHTDRTGSTRGNELLSLKRANAVKKFFVQKGISESRLHVNAVAAEAPLVTGATKDANAQNRRVEIKLL